MSTTGRDTAAEAAGGSWSGGTMKQSGTDAWHGAKWSMFSMDEKSGWN